MDSEGQQGQKSPNEEEKGNGTVPSSRPISPRYPGTRRVSFAEPVVPGTLEEVTEPEDDDDGVTVQDLRGEVSDLCIFDPLVSPPFYL